MVIHQPQRFSAVVVIILHLSTSAAPPCQTPPRPHSLAPHDETHLFHQHAQQCQIIVVEHVSVRQERRQLAELRKQLHSPRDLSAGELTFEISGQALLAFVRPTPLQSSQQHDRYVTGSCRRSSEGLSGGLPCMPRGSRPFGRMVGALYHLAHKPHQTVLSGHPYLFFSKSCVP